MRNLSLFMNGSQIHVTALINLLRIHSQSHSFGTKALLLLLLFRPSFLFQLWALKVRFFFKFAFWIFWLRMCLDTAYFAETEKLLLKVL